MSGQTGVYDVTASGGDLATLDATVALSFASDQNIADLAGNPLTDTAPTGTNENSYTVDNTAPTVRWTLPTSLVLEKAIAVGPITTDDDIVSYSSQGFPNGLDVAQLDGDVFGRPRTVGPAITGTVTVTDRAGNTAQFMLDFPAVVPDAVAPTVVSITREQTQTVSDSASLVPAGTTILTWRVTFSERVTGVDATDFTFSGPGQGFLVVSHDGRVNPDNYAVYLRNANLSAFDGQVTLGFNEDQNIVDLSGNALENVTPSGANDNAYTVDSTAPTVAITEVPTASDAPFTATITFSEAVTGFEQGDIAASPNADLSDFTDTTPGMVWTVLVTPTADGEVTLDIAAGVAMDAAGNSNEAAPQASSTYTAPTVQDSALWSATLTVADVIGSFGCSNSAAPNLCSSSSLLTDDDFELGGVTYVVREVLISQFGNFDFGFNPALAAGIDADNLTITVDGQEVDVTFYRNRSGFSARNPGFTWTAGQTVALGLFNADTMAPTVTITDVPAASDAPFTATITFSEAVTGFTVDDITETNAMLSAFTETTSGTVWTVLVTPTVTGPVTLDIAADGAIDSGGNGNTVADRATSTYTAPVVPASCPAPDFGTREQIWTGTVTVGADTTPVVGPLFHGFDIIEGGLGGTIGALDDTEFTIGGRDYTIKEVYVSAASGDSGELSFGLSSDLTAAEKAALQLHVCATAYNFSAASGPGDNNTYFWNAGLDWSGESTRTLYLSLPANSPATGTSTIASDGAAAVGDTLTVSAVDIKDADGLPDSFSYAWLREDADRSNQVFIQFATLASYTLDQADVGKRVRAQVVFDDDLGREEIRESAAFPSVGTVTPAVSLSTPSPTVSISGPSAAVTEGASLTFTLALDAAAPADGLSVALTVSETGDAVTGSDKGSRTVTILAGGLKLSSRLRRRTTAMTRRPAL